ncbi:sulfurtransferase [Gammaproteobacteria bacterium]|nr:sulfurtransferase [Gammaproteobacteria bacterium]
MLNTLVSVGDLSANLDNSSWCIVDCRFSLADALAGQRAYDEAHIPGSYYVNLETTLSSPHIAGQTGRHPLPDKNVWISRVNEMGINPQVQVVVYDDAGGAMAARMWWMLRWIGHENVAVLDGGWQAWQREGLAVSAVIPEPAQRTDTDYDALPFLVSIVEADAVDGRNQTLLDARELPRYKGDVEPLDPVAGHIPGAACSPFSANLEASGSFRTASELRKKFKQALESNKPIVCYCGSGVTAAHNILALKVAGVDEVALYPGSWSEWVTDAERPIASGDGD